MEPLTASPTSPRPDRSFWLADLASPTWPPSGLLLTHGAGGDRDHHGLLALESALAPLPVRRVNFPYRDEGRKAPDRANKILPFLEEAAADFAASLGVGTEAIALGGRSFGGRMCSLAASGGLPTGGLVLLSYPLHPPGKPDKLRVEHFGELDLPCLFVSGDRDPFGTPEEFLAHTGAIPGTVTHVWLEGGRHDPKPDQDPEIVEAVAAWLGG
jgi:predicted alpha/beta-hydrolase family hydrolase